MCYDVRVKSYEFDKMKETIKLINILDYNMLMCLSIVMNMIHG